jgi:hypothetical protein
MDDGKLVESCRSCEIVNKKPKINMSFAMYVLR